MGVPDEDDESGAKTIDKGSAREERLVSDQSGLDHQR